MISLLDSRESKNKNILPRITLQFLHLCAKSKQSTPFVITSPCISQIVAIQSIIIKRIYPPPSPLRKGGGGIFFCHCKAIHANCQSNPNHRYFVFVFFSKIAKRRDRYGTLATKGKNFGWIFSPQKLKSLFSLCLQDEFVDNAILC